MSFNFDEIVDRRRTKSIKHDFPNRMGKAGYNAVPLWIADMDFRSPDCVRDAIHARAEHGLFGYSESDGDYFDAVKQWMRARHGWDIEPQWLVKTEGVLPAVSAAIAVLTKPGDGVLLQYPAYSQFISLIEGGGRRAVKNRLVLQNGRYEVDYDDFEQKIIREKARLFILCSPHNPTGRVWTAEELRRMGDICVKHGVRIVADEIFQDLVYAPHRHQVFAALSEEFADAAVTCTAPTKSFNLSGAAVSNIFIADDELRRDFADELHTRGHLGCGILPLIACQAAYDGGAAWLDALLAYLSGNVDFARGFLKARLPEIGFIEPESTYLLWLDFRALGYWANELEVFLAEEAKLLVNGAPGAEGFLRVNIACPRAVLEGALFQLEQAVRKKK
jgi:cystathionine beta-lyase